jgi:hypothetical protein
MKPMGNIQKKFSSWVLGVFNQIFVLLCRSRSTTAFPITARFPYTEASYLSHARGMPQRPLDFFSLAIGIGQGFSPLWDTIMARATSECARGIMDGDWLRPYHKHCFFFDFPNIPREILALVETVEQIFDFGVNFSGVLSDDVPCQYSAISVSVSSRQ